MVSEPYASRPAEQGDAAVPAEQRRVAPARLVMTRPERLAGMLFPLGGGQVVLGRGAAADISLDDGHVSRAHALLRGTHAGYVVEDLGSSGGTSVNGKRLTGPHQLRGNDVLRLGPFIEARFEQSVDVDQTIVLPADSDLTIQLPAPADVDVTRPLRPGAPSAAPPSGAVAFVPPPPPSEAPYLAPTSVSRAPSGAAAVSASAVEPPTTALPTVPPLPPVAPLSSAAYHRQVMVERDRALRRAARTKRRAGWLMVTGLILLLAGGATYGWILLRYYTKVDPVTGEHPHTLRLFGDPVNDIPVGKIAFGVTVGGLALLLVGIILRIVAAGRLRRARRLLVPLSAMPGSHPAPPPAYAPAAQAPPGAPLPPAYPPMTPMEPYPPRPGWPRL
ncbi:MAG: FHA domain-containing protein [Frankiaceae bacterium]